jgi:hypothetical protein
MPKPRKHTWLTTADLDDHAAELILHATDDLHLGQALLRFVNTFVDPSAQSACLRHARHLCDTLFGGPRHAS